MPVGYILMFGLSRDTRWRMEEAERTAKAATSVAEAARDIGNKALTAIAAHLAACAPIQEDTKRRLGNIEDQNKWQTRYIITLLISVLLAILMGWAEHKGLF